MLPVWIKKGPEMIIENRDQMLDYLAAGSKPDRTSWRIGSEHEKFVFHQGDLAPLAYHGADGRPGIADLLQGFVDAGFDPITEGDHLIACKKDGASITLEPGGQFELSGAPLETLHQTCKEIADHIALAKEIGDRLDIGFLGLGFHPFLKRDDIPHMPKARYDIMRRYMPKVGSLGLDMMHRSCTVQVNLDFASEQDMVEKFRLSLAIQPLATVLFASSPFKEGVDTGYQSYRSHIWTDTDSDRCGMLPFVFEEGFGFERYLDYVLDVPMYFIKRQGQMIDCAGQNFRDFMAGRLPALPGNLPTMTDFEDHLTTIFPEVRLKTFLEMRGADGASRDTLCALPAFWVGLLYDEQAQAEALERIQDWSIEDISALRDSAPKQGLNATIAGETLGDIAKDMVSLSSAGLGRRAAVNAVGDTEQLFLAKVKDRLAHGQTESDILRSRLQSDWDGDIATMVRAIQY